MKVYSISNVTQLHYNPFISITFLYKRLVNLQILATEPHKISQLIIH